MLTHQVISKFVPMEMKVEDAAEVQILNKFSGLSMKSMVDDMKDCLRNITQNFMKLHWPLRAMILL